MGVDLTMPQHQAALILSRLGEKGKPLWTLCDETALLEYQLRLARRAGLVTLVMVDRGTAETDALPVIAKRYRAHWEDDPKDVTRIEDVVRWGLLMLSRYTDTAPDVVHILQPTYPFVSLDSLLNLSRIMDRTAAIATAQTIVPVPHCFHEANQRAEWPSLGTWFVDEKRRQEQHNKQAKPARWAFGGLLSIRPKHFRQTGELWAKPSFGVKVDWFEGWDVDTALALQQARAFINAGMVPGWE